MASVNSPSVGN